MSRLSKSDYDYINLATCIRGQANWLGIEHEGIPLEGVVVRLANTTPPGSEQADREPSVDVTDALAYLDELNETDRIEYDDYRNLHDLISVAAEPQAELFPGTLDALNGLTIREG